MRCKSPLVGVYPRESWLIANLAREKTSRCTSWKALISHENTMLDLPRSMQMCSTTFIMNEVLPIDGRAAMTNISPGFKPLVLRSNSSNPLEIPCAPFSPASSAWNCSSTSLTDCLMLGALFVSAPSRMASTLASTESSSAATSSGASYA